MIEVIPYTIDGSPSSTGSCVLTLATLDGTSRLPIVIGQHEARAILIVQSGTQTQRPLTHQLMKTIMDTYGLHLEFVSLDRVVEGLFYATLHLSDGFNSRDIDSRATDAIALALLFGAPIYITPALLDECGIAVPTPKSAEPTLESLTNELHRCEATEDYERAAEIQAQIDRLKEEQQL